ncbi:AsmA family protein [Camelimonas abortus]|uniref:AsmA family protein n=1 Tax=Camelimonas abortus TaxID=1017184 RepID=A0ABV7LFB5_9HYPH
MRRRTVLLLTVAGLAAAGAGAVPWTVMDRRAVSQISRDFAGGAGLWLEAGGPVTLAVLPVPRIKIDHVRLVGADGAVVARARQLRGELRLLPLLAGRFELDDLTLIEPVFRAPPADADGAALWSAALAASTEMWRRASGGAWRPRRVTLVAGAFDAADGRAALARDISLTATWPSPASPVAISGVAAIGGEAYEISVSGFSPEAVATDGSCQVTARLSGAPLKAELRGALTDGARRFEGQASLSAPAIGRLAPWRNLNLDRNAGDLPASVEGRLTVNARSAALSPATARIGDNTLEGALSLRPGDAGGWALAGTLAADTLDLRFAGGGAWWSQPPFLASDGLRDWEVDLRLSAASVRLTPELRASDVATSIVLRHGRVEAVLGSASLLGGALKGRLNAAPSAAGLDMRLQVSAEGLDATRLAFLQGGPIRVSGTLGGAMTLEGEGATRETLLRNMRGEGHAQVSGGELGGLALAALARRGEAPAADEPVKLRGRTAFSSLQARWTLSPPGMLGVTGLTVSGSGFTASLSGEAGLSGQPLALEGALTPANGAPLRLRLSGAWSSPSLAVSAAGAPPQATPP